MSIQVPGTFARVLNLSDKQRRITMFDWLFDFVGGVLDWLDGDDDPVVNRRPATRRPVNSRYVINRPGNPAVGSKRRYGTGVVGRPLPRKPLVPGPFHPSNPSWRHNPANPNNPLSPLNPNNPNSPRNLHNRHRNLHNQHRPHGHRSQFLQLSHLCRGHGLAGYS